MNITDLLPEEAILLEAAPATKKEAIDLAIQAMEKSGVLSDTAVFRKYVYEREEECTTGIGGGLAIPHGKSKAVKTPALAALVIPKGVSFEALDHQPVTLLFLIAAPSHADQMYLDVLSRLSVLLLDKDLREKLCHANTKSEFLNLLKKAEKEKEKADTGIRIRTEKTPSFRLLAVTSCPAGLAHTYMAAESIEKAAQKRNCLIRVETRGCSGVEHPLTEKEIAAADGILIASDLKVPMDRFEGKPVLCCPVSDGIRCPGKMIEKVMSGQVPVYHAEKEHMVTTLESSGTDFLHLIYSQLMNGVSHMIPFVVGGGILIAISLFIDGFVIDIEGLGITDRFSFGMITPVASTLRKIGNIALALMLPVLAGYIAEAAGDRAALAPGFIGGFLAAKGTSGFLGALIAGFAAGYIVLFLKKISRKFPDGFRQISPMLLYPVLGTLVTGIFMMFFVEPVMGRVNLFLNHWLTDMGVSSKVVLGIVLGSMMAIDMGGPFNKAAYVFGTAAIADGNYDIMASVMIGGMVPPCALALAAFLFPSRFTREERSSAPVSFLFGLSFITEGAIPYAAADPIHVLPACILGSGLAGGLSMIFHCTLMAPHGGIFVVPVMGHAGRYLIALATGTLVGAFFLRLFKKPILQRERKSK